MRLIRPLSTLNLQPDQYRPRKETKAWVQFPAKYFHLNPKDIWTAAGARTRFFSISGRWPGSRLQVFALSWPDGTTWDIDRGWRHSHE